MVLLIKDRTQRQTHAHELPPSPEQQKHESELLNDDEIGLLRTYVQQAALRMAATLSANLESPTLYHKVSALNGLLDLLPKSKTLFRRCKTRS
jgi:hypothetical protein